MDHIQLVSRTNEYEIPHCMCFIDYEKPFDSVRTISVINALKEQVIHGTYIKTIKKICRNATSSVQMHEETGAFKTKKGVRQGDTISPKLFTAALKEFFKTLDWEEKGIKTVSVAVSVLTLTFISVDRWYAICFPLKFKSTTGRAKTAILVIWFVALCFDIPELVVLRTQHKELRVDTILLTQCAPSWSPDADMAFTVAKSILLYTVPLVFMTVAYCQIVRVLWRSANIPGHTEAKAVASAAASESSHGANHGCTCSNAGSAAIRCCFHQGTHCGGRQHHHGGGVRGLGGGVTSASRHTTSSVGGTGLITNANASTEGQLRSRRKAAKMLVAVVLMFAFCYFPVHLLGILRYIIVIPQTDEMVALSMLSHWLCYANSAVNPVIYNFMSGKFRKEFRRTFCFWWRHRPRERGQGGRRTNGSIVDRTAKAKRGGQRVRGWLKGRQRSRHGSMTTTAHSRGSSYYKSLFRSTLHHNTSSRRSGMATEYEDYEVGSSYVATARTEVLPLSGLGSATVMVVEVD